MAGWNRQPCARGITLLQEWARCNSSLHCLPSFFSCLILDFCWNLQSFINPMLRVTVPTTQNRLQYIYILQSRKLDDMSSYRWTSSCIIWDHCNPRNQGKFEFRQFIYCISTSSNFELSADPCKTLLKVLQLVCFLWIWYDLVVWVNTGTEKGWIWFT